MTRIKTTSESKPMIEESPNEKIKKPRKQRIDKGKTLLTDRDEIGLTFVGEQYAVRLDQLAKLFKMDEYKDSEQAVRKIVDRWRKKEIVVLERMSPTGVGWVYLTPEGLKDRALPYKAWTPKSGRMRHLFYINETRLLLEKNGGLKNAIWVSERKLLSQQEDRAKRPPKHLPDAEIHQDDEKVIAVEVEISPKEKPRLQRFIMALAKSYDEIWYYVPSTVKPFVVRAYNGLSPTMKDKVKILDLPDMPTAPKH